MHPCSFCALIGGVQAECTSASVAGDLATVAMRELCVAREMLVASFRFQFLAALGHEWLPVILSFCYGGAFQCRACTSPTWDA